MISYAGGTYARHDGPAPYGGATTPDAIAAWRASRAETPIPRPPKPRAPNRLQTPSDCWAFKARCRRPATARLRLGGNHRYAGAEMALCTKHLTRYAVTLHSAGWTITDYTRSPA